MLWPCLDISIDLEEQAETMFASLILSVDKMGMDCQIVMVKSSSSWMEVLSGLLSNGMVHIPFIAWRDNRMID